MSKSKSSSEKPIDAKFSSLLKEAEKAETEDQIEKVLARVADLKRSVAGKKHSSDLRQKEPSGSDRKLFAECERVINDRLRKMRKNIRCINVSKQSNGSESCSKGREGSKTLSTKKLHTEAVHERQQLQEEYERARQKAEKLESQLDRSLEMIQNQKEQIELLKHRLQSEESLRIEKILSPAKADPDKTVVDTRSHQRTELWDRDINLSDSSALLKEKQRIVDRYQERMNQKNTLIGELKQQVIRLQADISGVKQQAKLEQARLAKEKEELKRLADSLTERLEYSLKEKDELRKLNHEQRQKNQVYQQEVEKLVAQRSLLKDTVNRDYTLLREELNRRDSRNDSIKRTSEPAAVQQKLDRYILLDRVQQCETEIQRLRRDLQEGETQNRELKLELNQSKQKLEEYEQKYSEKKLKYGDLKRELERVKSQTMLRTAQDRSLAEEDIRKSPALDQSSKNIERRIRALQGIKSMIRRFPR